MYNDTALACEDCVRPQEKHPFVPLLIFIAFLHTLWLKKRLTVKQAQCLIVKDRPPSALDTHACTLGRYQLQWMEVSNSNGPIKCGSHFTAKSAHISLTIAVIFLFRAPKIKQWTLTLSVTMLLNGICKIISCFFITFTAAVCLSVNILLLLFTFFFHASMSFNTQKQKKLF